MFLFLKDIKENLVKVVLVNGKIFLFWLSRIKFYWYVYDFYF